MTFTFSEAVKNFTNADLTIENGTLSSVASANGGVIWTATFTPTANVSDTSNVITLKLATLTDLVANAGVGTKASGNYAIDTLRPTLTSAVFADNFLSIGQTSLVTFTFSEAVKAFSNTDLTIENGTLSSVATANGGLTWTATFTPTANVSDTSNRITVNLATLTDLLNNAGVGTKTSGNYAIDTLRPTLTSLVVADTDLRRGETSLVTFTFSEAVKNFSNSDLTIVNGTVTGLASANGGLTWTALFTPTVNVVNDPTNVITVNLATLTDLLNNAGTGNGTSNNFAINTI